MSVKILELYAEQYLQVLELSSELNTHIQNKSLSIEYLGIQKVVNNYDIKDFNDSRFKSGYPLGEIVTIHSSGLRVKTVNWIASWTTKDLPEDQLTFILLRYNARIKND